MTPSEIVNIKWSNPKHEPREFQIHVQPTFERPPCGLGRECYLKAAKHVFFGTMFGIPLEQYRVLHPKAIRFS